MSQSLPSPQKPSSTAPFGVWLDYYTQRAHLSQNQLAIAARMNQSTLNKIANEQIIDVAVDTLFTLSLILRLSEKETLDLMARKERAFSPSNPKHKVYLEIMRQNNKSAPDFNTSFRALTWILDEADEFLMAKGYKPLSNQI